MTVVKVGSIASMGLAAYGATQAGILGLLTGFFTGFVCTVGVSIAFGEKESMGDQNPHSSRGRRQRLTGAMIAVGTPFVAVATGWRWGWAATIGLFVGTVGVMWVLDAVLTKRGKSGSLS